MGSESLHEPAERLSGQTIEMHRAITSLIEELEAVDWYAQRVDASSDPELRRVLAHNRDEEKEHACMTLEWIRRQDPVFDRMLRTYLFRSGPIREAEEGPEEGAEAETPEQKPEEPTLRIGSLRAKAVA
jgi:ferritin-like protein